MANRCSGLDADGGHHQVCFGFNHRKKPISQWTVGEHLDPTGRVHHLAD
jgi:hypothetical protein